MALSTAAALEQPGPLIAAWSRPEGGQVQLSIFSVAGDKAQQFSIEELAQEDVAARRSAIARADLRNGTFDPSSARVWTITPAEFRAWGTKGLQLVGTDTTLQFGEHKIARADIARITVTVDAERIERALVAELKDGTTRTLTSEISSLAASYDQYGDDDLLFDSSWAIVLGQDLAEWLGVPFADRRFT